MCTNKKLWTFEEVLLTKKELTFKLFVWCLYSSIVIIEDTADQNKRLSKQEGGGDGDGESDGEGEDEGDGSKNVQFLMLYSCFEVNLWTVNHVKEILRGERLEVIFTSHFSNQFSI